MDYFILFAIVVIVVVIILVINVIKGLLKIAFSLFLLFLLLVGIFGYFAYKDSKDIINGVREKPNLFILKDNQTIISAFTMYQLNLSTAKSLEESVLREISKAYKKQDIKSIKKDNYKVIIIDKKAFPKTKEFNPDKIISSIQNKEQLKFIEAIVPENYDDEQAIAFTILISLALKEDPLFLIKEYKKGNVLIYEETFIFKVLKLMKKN